MVESKINLIDPSCSFCDYSLHEKEFPHFKQYGQDVLTQYIVAETNNFKVKPDILPGNPDGRHLLVHPKNHVYNHASLVEDADEVGSLLYKLEQKFGKLVIFEHGGMKRGNKIQSIYHAHFHIYGGLENVDVVNWMEFMLSGSMEQDEVYPYEVVPAPDYAFITNLSGRFNGVPYLYVEQGSRGLIVEDREDLMKSQITQRSMHRLFSGKVLDWKKIPENEEFARESVRRIRNLIDFCSTGKPNTHAF